MSDATRKALDDFVSMRISIHAPRERCDIWTLITLGRPEIAFQSTHRVSDATKWQITINNPEEFQSTHRVSDATTTDITCLSSFIISIHTPRERCDVDMLGKLLVPSISIHAPRERCDFSVLELFNIFLQFQSTHRVSDATWIWIRSQWMMTDFNPRTA